MGAESPTAHFQSSPAPPKLKGQSPLQSKSCVLDGHTHLRRQPRLGCLVPFTSAVVGSGQGTELRLLLGMGWGVVGRVQATQHSLFFSLQRVV